MIRGLIRYLVLIILVPLGVGAAVPANPELPRGFKSLGPAAGVSAVSDGDTLTLDDGREVRLVGIQAPKLPLGRPNFMPWPLGDTAKTALETLVAGRRVSLYRGGMAADRHGRVLAQLVRDDGLWIQGELLRQGMARVYSFPDNRTGVAAMLVLEDSARQARRGLWADPFYAIRDKTTVGTKGSGFELVEDVVYRAAKVRTTLYLNFAADWRQTFTVRVNARTVRVFDRSGIDLTQLAGKRVRVRGWVKWEGRPVIDVTHPEQLQVLDMEPGSGTKPGKERGEKQS